MPHNNGPVVPIYACQVAYMSPSVAVSGTALRV